MKNPEEMDKTGDECWFNRYFSLMVKIPFETLLKMLNWLSSFLKKVPSNVISFKGTRQMNSGTFVQFSNSQRREWKWNLGDLGNYFRLFFATFWPKFGYFHVLGKQIGMLYNQTVASTRYVGWSVCHEEVAEEIFKLIEVIILLHSLTSLFQIWFQRPTFLHPESTPPKKPWIFIGLAKVWQF